MNDNNQNNNNKNDSQLYSSLDPKIQALPALEVASEKNIQGYQEQLATLLQENPNDCYLIFSQFLLQKRQLKRDKKDKFKTDKENNYTDFLDAIKKLEESQEKKYFSQLAEYQIKDAEYIPRNYLTFLLQSECIYASLELLPVFGMLEQEYLSQDCNNGSIVIQKISQEDFKKITQFLEEAIEKGFYYARVELAVFYARYTFFGMTGEMRYQKIKEILSSNLTEEQIKNLKAYSGKNEKEKDILTKVLSNELQHEARWRKDLIDASEKHYSFCEDFDELALAVFNGSKAAINRFLSEHRSFFDSQSLQEITLLNKINFGDFLKVDIHEQKDKEIERLISMHVTHLNVTFNGAKFKSAIDKGEVTQYMKEVLQINDNFFEQLSILIYQLADQFCQDYGIDLNDEKIEFTLKEDSESNYIFQITPKQYIPALQACQKIINGSNLIFFNENGISLFFVAPIQVYEINLETSKLIQVLRLYTHKEFVVKVTDWIKKNIASENSSIHLTQNKFLKDIQTDFYDSHGVFLKALFQYRDIWTHVIKLQECYQQHDKNDSWSDPKAMENLSQLNQILAGHLTNLNQVLGNRQSEIFSVQESLLELSLPINQLSSIFSIAAKLCALDFSRKSIDPINSKIKEILDLIENPNIYELAFLIVPEARAMSHEAFFHLILKNLNQTYQLGYLQKIIFIFHDDFKALFIEAENKKEVFGSGSVNQLTDEELKLKFIRFLEVLQKLKALDRQINTMINLVRKGNQSQAIQQKIPGFLKLIREIQVDSNISKPILSNTKDLFTDIYNITQILGAVKRTYTADKTWETILKTQAKTYFSNNTPCLQEILTRLNQKKPNFTEIFKYLIQAVSQLKADEDSGKISIAQLKILLEVPYLYAQQQAKTAAQPTSGNNNNTNSVQNVSAHQPKTAVQLPKNNNAQPRGLPPVPPANKPKLLPEQIAQAQPTSGNNNNANSVQNVSAHQPKTAVQLPDNNNAQSRALPPVPPANKPKLLPEQIAQAQPTSGNNNNAKSQQSAGSPASQQGQNQSGKPLQKTPAPPGPSKGGNVKGLSSIFENVPPMLGGPKPSPSQFGKK